MWPLVAILLLAARTDGQTTSSPSCFNNLAYPTFIIQPSWLSASSENITEPANSAIYAGWCAQNNDTDPWVEITFPQSYGIKGIMVGPKTSQTTSFPKRVHVQYTPNGENTLQELPLPGGKLEITATNITNTNMSFTSAFAMKSLRFNLKDYFGAPCLKLEVYGCPLSEVCPGGCQHGGLCVTENQCRCQNGYHGSACDIQECSPVPVNDLSIDASSEDPNFPMAEVINDYVLGRTDPNRGWCPSINDANPWIEFTLNKTLSISVFAFDFPIKTSMEKEFMKEFDLQYVSPVDSSNTFRTYAQNLPSINDTHIFTVSLIPSLSTRVILIKPTKVQRRACFRVLIKACDPTNSCSANFCLNGGSCIGPNMCKCASGFIGERCEQKKTDITTTSVSFVNITNNILITTSINFIVTGQVTLQTVNNVQVVSLQGTNSYITVDPSSFNVPCLSNIDACTNGFTFALDLNFKSIANNTYLISSGGDLDNHKGIALYYVHNSLVFVVSTSTQIWHLTVPYIPVLNTWQHFEITWNKNLGVELHVNSVVLGTSTKPDVHVATQTASICLGCSHTSISTVLNILIQQIQAWTIDRTDLVNVGIASTPIPATTTRVTTPAATTTHPPTTTAGPPASTNKPTTAAATTPQDSSAITTTIISTTQKPKECKATALGLASGAIPSSSIDFSTQDHNFPAAQIGNDGYNGTNTGWCPETSDHQPWIEVQLNKPMAISSLSFNFPSQKPGDSTKMYMTYFELQYVSQHDKEAIYRTYATSIPSMNSTHFFDVTLPTSVVTSILLIKPGKSVERPCFKLELFGCDPNALCADKFCMNGGTCNGPNTCSCPDGFYGDRCQLTKTDINSTSTAVSFVNITNNILVSTSVHFNITGQVSLQTVNNVQAVLINGSNSFITVDPATVKVPCLLDIDKCTNGFTFALDLNFVHNLVNNTYLISSGGDLDNHKGIALYYIHNSLVFVVSTSTQIWHLTVPYTPVLNTWQHFVITWNKHLGVELHVNGQVLGTAGRPDNRPASQILNICLGCSHTNLSVILNVLIKEVFSWTISRVDLVNIGLINPSVQSFIFDLTKLVNGNVIIGSGFNITMNGTSQVTDGGLMFNASQYIDFGSGSHLMCLIDPSSCTLGLTIQLKIRFKRIEENTYLFNSGAQTPDGVGLAIIYRFGKIQFVLSTHNQSWFVTCGKNEIKPNRFQTVMITWSIHVGLEVFVDNVLIEGNKNPVHHVATSSQGTNVVLGLQTSTSVKVDFLVSLVSIWYAQVDILVTHGICKPPVRPTAVTTAAPVTPAPTTPATSITSMVTTNSPGQCPVGCISIGTSGATPASSQPTMSTQAPTTSKAPTTTKAPSTTQVPTTTQAPTTTHAPTTTDRGVPNYNVKPNIGVTIGKDNNSYLSCLFTGSSQPDVVLVVKLLVAGKVVMTETVPGTSGTVLFSVIQLNLNLYMKPIECSVTAHFVGSTATTPTYTSPIFTPQFVVTPDRLIVIEGHSTEFVTVSTNVPPQFFCCDGCKGQCQIHIVGSFHYNRQDKKCGQTQVIAQAVIESQTPPHYNRPICGFALTMANWEQTHKIGIKATLDLRRDGDHSQLLELTAHVYNQQVNTQITTTANSFSITAHPVQVNIKDNDHNPDTCKSVNDPHLTTFDNRRFNNMHEGQFILFRHKTLPIEIRAFYYKCSRHSHATCNCAVAIKSGDDVIAITGCHGTTGGHPGQGHGIGLIMQHLFGNPGGQHGGELARTPMTIQIYKNGDLTPGTFIRRYGCGQKYEIQLPTGMIVTVAQSFKPFINIWIKASSYDRGNAEGLCGNFDGSATNDLNNINSHINQWKAPQTFFFQGVGASSQVFWATYCSCVQGYTQICSPGLGYIQCSTSNHDVTASLLSQAQRPILTNSQSSKNQHGRTGRSVDSEEDIEVYLDTDIPEDEDQLSFDDAVTMCTNELMNNTVTKTCTPILTTNLTDQIQNCASDYNATGSFEWAKDAIRDIIVDCVDSANRLKANDTAAANSTTPGENVPSIEELDKILDKACVEDCGTHGACQEGVCTCDSGYTGEYCNISSTTVPTISSVPILCDISQTSDCSSAMLYGINIVQSPSLTCHYYFIELADENKIIGENGTVPAVFLSQNKALCPLPKLQSSVIRLSNDGLKLSNQATTHVVYSSICYACTIINITDTQFGQRCTREDSTCIIDGGCYASGDRKPGSQCKVCYPDDTDSAWSDSREASCVAVPVVQSQTNGMERTQVIILAVVCAVLAAVIIIGTFYICRTRSKKPSKSEFGQYEVTPDQRSAIILPRENLTYKMEKL